jgi:hypothetical protein
MLLRDYEIDKYYVEHNMDSMLRANIVQRYQAYATGRQWGFQSANDIRRMENMDSIDGGDIYLSPANMIPSEMVGKVPPPSTQVPGKGGFGGKDNAERVNTAFEPLFRAMMQRVVNRETIAISKKIGRSRDELMVFLDEFYGKELPEYIRQTLDPVVRAYLQSVSDDEIGDDSVQAYTDRFVMRYTALNRGLIENIIGRNGDVNRQELIMACIEDWKESKVDAVVDVEIANITKLASKLQ